MPPTIGTRLGPYEIISAIGAGGMGEVYRARDTRLNRDVALKVLPEAFTLDPDRLARFKREAQVLASLNQMSTRDVASIVASQPRLWSDARFAQRPRQRHLDLHPDGERLAVAAVPETRAAVRQDKVVFIFNFFDELRRIAPTKR